MENEEKRVVIEKKEEENIANKSVKKRRFLSTGSGEASLVDLSASISPEGI